MSQIQWYPGHMAKSFRELEKNLRQVEIVMILLDARIPMSSMNPEILRRLHNKPVLILFNKQDLADQKILSLWENYYRQSGYYTLSIDATSPQSLRSIYSLVKDVILKEQVERNLRRGRQLAPFKTMILGIPNVGKSTLINNLTAKGGAKVENRPGVTRQSQWYRLSDEFELLDTPGVLWPKFEKTIGYNLAITGAIKDDILPLDDIVIYALKYLSKHYQSSLVERYKLTSTDDVFEILNQIGTNFGALTRGGEINYDRVYAIVLKDIRDKRLGGLCFEKPWWQLSLK